MGPYSLAAMWYDVWKENNFIMIVLNMIVYRHKKYIYKVGLRTLFPGTIYTHSLKKFPIYFPNTFTQK